MSSFLERLNAKKAAMTAKAQEAVDAPKPTAEEPVPVPVQAPEKLSFAERMRLKREEAAKGNGAAPIAVPIDASKPKAESKPEPKVEASPLPKVKISADVIKRTNAMLETNAAIEADVENASTELIKERIQALGTVEGFELKTAMDGLRNLILANPSACALLLPEDVGEMVSALRRMTNNTKAASMATPTRASKKAPTKILNPDDLDALLGDLL